MWSADSDFRADLARYRRADWLREPSLWAIAVYRFGRWAGDRAEPLRSASLVVYGALHLAVSLLTGISIPKSAVVGGGLRIYHFGGIVVHPASRVGRDCTLGHGVTLGMREEEDTAPILEDGVVLSAYAQVLGGVRVGRGAKVGAMSVVLRDVPPGATVAGVPARVVGQRATEG